MTDQKVTGKGVADSSITNPDSHVPVLRDEAVAALMSNPDGCYVDCTYGRGGHSALILAELSDQGRLLVIDKDMAAIGDARQKYANDPRVIICHGSFADLAEFVAAHQLPPLTGVLLDLGISSPQINHAERGFSFDRNGPLDMRMDQTQGRTASDWVMEAGEQEIIDVLRNYGEERFARRIAQASWLLDWKMLLAQPMSWWPLLMPPCHALNFINTPRRAHFRPSEFISIMSWVMSRLPWTVHSRA